MDMRKKAPMVGNGLMPVPDIVIAYRGFEIVPKKDFWIQPHQDCGGIYKKGYVVTDGISNVMPGAAWARSVVEAKAMVDALVEAGEDSDKFWQILRERQGLAEWEEV